MAVGVFTDGGTFTTANNANKSFADASIPIGVAPIVVVAATGNTATQGCTDNSADGLGTYTAIASSFKAASADKFTILIRNSLTTINNEAGLIFTTTGLTVSTGGGLFVNYVGGIGTLAGASLVRSVSGTPQVAQQDNLATGTPSVTFPATTLTTNAIIGFNWYTTNGVPAAQPAGFFHAAAIAFATPATGANVVAANSGFAATTFTWAGSESTSSSSMLIEIDCTVAAVVLPPRPVSVTQVAAAMAVRAKKLTYGWTRAKNGLMLPEMGWA